MIDVINDDWIRHQDNETYDRILLLMLFIERVSFKKLY